jgi:hypothetical protein
MIQCNPADLAGWPDWPGGLTRQNPVKNPEATR